MANEDSLQEPQHCIQQILEAETNDFVELARIAGLDIATDFAGADLSGAGLSGADLSGADLSGANLSLAKLSGADLSGADLRGADLSETDLSGAKLSRAKLSRAKLMDTFIYLIIIVATLCIFSTTLYYPEILIINIIKTVK
jgi:uncharacterized protein YjbI with pentapeptide repeats